MIKRIRAMDIDPATMRLRYGGVVRDIASIETVGEADGLTWVMFDENDGINFASDEMVSVEVPS
jgi:hypothetical protein